VTSTGWTILIGYTALSLIGIAIMLYVFRSTRVGFRIKVATRETLEKRESMWGVLVVTFLVILLGATIFSIPYWSKDHTDPEQVIDVTGRQYAWTVDPPQARTGLETRFDVHVEDVNHGLGLYDPDGKLINQINVLPGVTQEMWVTFDEPGTYEIRCLEYCGLDHHLMENTLEVKR
jgi:cytochrome c oxidase subunit II